MAGGEKNKAPLLEDNSSSLKTKLINHNENDYVLHYYHNEDLAKRVWIESNKFWHIAGPAIFSRITSYSMQIITQSFAGHLGDLELASMSLATNVISGFCFGLLLGMASALETLCGQAYGAKKYHMLGIYMQRSWIVMFIVAVLLLPMYIFATPILKLMGQPEDLAEQAGLENWYYKILLLMTGNLSNIKTAVDALSVCMSINAWEMMVPLAFFAATGVRVANELGAGNGKGAKFSMVVSVATSLIIGLVFCTIIMISRDKLAIIFTSSIVVLHAVDKLAVLLAITILLNSIQPVLSGVAVGSGWQSSVAYINIGCYYIIGLPLSAVLGWVFDFGVSGIWSGMIGGTAVQTIILIIVTLRCDWELMDIDQLNDQSLYSLRGYMCLMSK